MSLPEVAIKTEHEYFPPLQDSLAGYVYASLDEIEVFYRMGVGIDAGKYALVGGFSPMAPVHVQSLGIRIYLDDFGVGGSRVDDFGDIELVGLSPEKKPAREVSSHCDEGMFDGSNEACRHFLFALRKARVDGGDDIVQFGKYSGG